MIDKTSYQTITFTPRIIQKHSSLVHGQKKITGMLLLLRGTPFCTSYYKASFTVEASLVFPVVLLFFAMILSLFTVPETELKLYHAMCETAKILSIQAYLTEDSTESEEHTSHLSSDLDEVLTSLLGAGEAGGILWANMTDESIYEHIVGGRAGIISTVEDNGSELVLNTSYLVELPITFFGKRYIPVHQEIKARKWTGYDFQKGEEDVEMVYVTPEGVAYHRERTCIYLQPSIWGISATELITSRNEDGEKYYPCEDCVISKVAGSYYIASYGNRYHETVTCRSLRRTVITLPITKVGGRHSCPKCGG